MNGGVKPIVVNASSTVSAVTDPSLAPQASPTITEQPSPPRPGRDESCVSCGSPQARSWSTPDGPARLCPPCAALHGVGCP